VIEIWMPDERMLGKVGRPSRKHDHILVSLLACSRNRNDTICIGRRGKFGFVFNRTVGVVIGGMWAGDIIGRGSATKDVDGGSPVAIAGTVVEEDLVKRNLDRWSRNAELIVVARWHVAFAVSHGKAEQKDRQSR